MNNKYLNAIICSILVGQLCINYATGYSSYCSYHSNRIDDGNKVVTNIASKHYDSRHSTGPDLDHRIIIEPSGSRSINNHLIDEGQLMSNRIGTGLEAELFGQPIFVQPINGGYRSRGFLTSARTVGSPALVVDSGGRPTGRSVANELAKLLHIKQGHYADLYDKMDRPYGQQLTGTTKPPVDSVEDAVRAAVVSLYNEQNRNQADKSK